MRTVRPASEQEVLDCFWTAELTSPRWTPADVEERKRSWHERVGLFRGLPRDLAWERVAVTRDELLEILYIDWDWWLRVSDGTRLPRVAAEVQGRDDGDRAIAAAVATNPELIVLTAPARSKLVVLEGHVRLTAYAAFPELLPAELELYLVGVSPSIDRWSEW